MTGVLGGGAAPVPWYLAGGVPSANCIAAYQPVGAANIAASYINLANPGTYDLTTTAAPTFSAETGWAFPGTRNKFLQTGITPAAGYSMIIQFSESSTNVVLAGAFKIGAYFQINPNQATNEVLYQSGGTMAVAVGMAAGNLCVAGNRGYRDGVIEAGTIPGWTDSAYTIWIGGTNNNGTLSNGYVGKIQALAIYDVTLTAPQVAAIASRMAEVALFFA